MSIVLAALVFLATFSLVSLAVWVARWWMERNSDGTDAPATPKPELDDDEEAGIVRDAEISTISLMANLLKRFDLVDRMQKTIEQADVDWTVGRLTAAMLLTGTLGLAIVTSFSWLPVWAVLLLSLGAALAPYFYLARQRDKRIDKIKEQFPEAMESVARAIRAGYPFSMALETVSQQAPDPLGKELKRTYAEGALGLTWEAALEQLAQRVPIQDAHLFVAIVAVQSRAGGNLAEVLDNLAENMREAAAIEGEVKTLSSQGRFAGYILSGLPIFIAGALFYVSPGFLMPLFEPGIGRTLLTAAAFGLVAAHFIIKKLVDIRL